MKKLQRYTIIIRKNDGSIQYISTHRMLSAAMKKAHAKKDSISFQCLHSMDGSLQVFDRIGSMLYPI